MALKRMEDLNERQALWLDKYILTGNSSKSAREAGYSIASANQSGMIMKKKFAHLITERAYDSIASLMPSAIRTLGECLVDDNGHVRMKAVEQILAISGIAGVEKKEVTITHRTDKEIDAELIKLLHRTKNVIDITPEPLDLTTSDIKAKDVAIEQ